MFLGRRTRTILAFGLAVLTLALSPRALFSRPVDVPRSQSSKRPHVPRHVLLQSSLAVARRTAEVCRNRAEFTRLIREARLEISRVLLGSPLPDSATVELRNPRYLRLFDDPHRQTSPPA
jgi:hypothetical protein